MMSEPTGASNGFDGLGVQVRYLGKDRGYAGVASRAIAAGDVLVRVPRSKMLTAEDARACPSVGAAARELSDHRALVLKLLHEKAKFDFSAQALRRETRDDSRDGPRTETPDGTSAFAPWLETLPDFTTLEETHPLLWRRERREACLKGSPTLWRVESAKARSAEDKMAIVSALAANEGETATLPSVRNMTIEDVLWATAIISSRAFYLENVDAFAAGDECDEMDETKNENDESDFGDDGDDAEFETVFAFGSDDFDDDDDDWSYDDDDEDVFEAFGGDRKRGEGEDKGEEERDVFDETIDDDDDFGLAKSVGAMALVPWADALNHSPRASAVASLRFDARAQVAELRASRAYEAHEEVFDTYGLAKTPAETFLAYGFAAFPPDVSFSSSEDAAAAAAAADDDDETSSFADDACVIPGSWFWAESEKAELERSAADASNALSLLAREEAAAGASHRSVVLGYLVAAGAAPEDVNITLRVKSFSGGDRNKSGGKTSSKSSAPVGDAALRWCAAATATRAELFEAGWRGPFSTDPAPAASTEANRKRAEALSRAEAARVVHALGSNQAARARARAALARLVARLLENYPSFAKEPSLAGGVGRAPSAGADAEPGIGIGIPPGSTAEAHDGRVATGDAAAALVLASEARAMRAALEALVGWT